MFRRVVAVDNQYRLSSLFQPAHKVKVACISSFNNRSTSKCHPVELTTVDFLCSTYQHGINSKIQQALESYYVECQAANNKDSDKIGQLTLEEGLFSKKLDRKSGLKKLDSECFRCGQVDLQARSSDWGSRMQNLDNELDFYQVEARAMLDLFSPFIMPSREIR